jgi:glyoxylase-like metal-dependent hydrolase (beta-lactamase superfamily II)
MNSSPIEIVKDTLWQITFYLRLFIPLPTNCWLLRDGDGLTLIDSGYFFNASALTDLICQKEAELSTSLTRIVVTHAHPDHAGSLKQLADHFRETCVYAHRDDCCYLTNDRSRQISFSFRQLSSNLFLKCNLRPLERGRLTELSGRLGSLQVISTPGHTPGSVSLWADLGQTKALFCGDNMDTARGGLKVGMNEFTLDCQDRDRNFQKYKGLDANLLLPGHGPPYPLHNGVDEILALVRN